MVFITDSVQNWKTYFEVRRKKNISKYVGQVTKHVPVFNMLRILGHLLIL